MKLSKMLLLLGLSVLVPMSFQQCPTIKDVVNTVKDTDINSLLDSELKFSIDMARTVTSLQPDQNLFFSPASVFKALLMTYFMSANHTAASLQEMLHLDDNNLSKNDYLGAYTVENFYQKMRSKKDGCQMNLVNRLYVDRSVKVQYCFRQLFENELHQVSFARNAMGIRKNINKWIFEQTNKFIRDFLGEDAISADTQVVLLNAAYFKGIWKEKFDPDNTANGPFFLSDRTEVEAPMMYQKNKFKMRKNEMLDAEVLELPYIGDEISMYYFLPWQVTPTALQEMVKAIDYNTFSTIVSDFEEMDASEMAVTIPKFTMEATLHLVPILESMGVGDLFQQTADLSTLTRTKYLSFSDAIHKAKITIDEKGTEAAAVTEAISYRMGPPQFKANRPFAYALFDKTTNKILFFGVYSSPP